MITAIDTNIFLDILIPNATHAQASKKSLDKVMRMGALVICEAVYGELASQFPTQHDLDRFLTDTRIQLASSLTQTLHHASAAWKTYSRSRGKDVQCPQCGNSQTIECSSCGVVIAPRQHILTDFLIGAHARCQADQFLTRDLSFYRTYFNDLNLFDTGVPI